MIRLSIDEVLKLHTVLTTETGGEPNIREIGLLESSLESAFQTFAGQELYPTIEEKGAWLGFSLISNHAFVDGNKRIGIYVMLIFLELNNVKMNPSIDEVVRVGLSVASGTMKYSELLDWVNSNKIGG